MRGNRLLYGIAAIALLVMLAVFIVSATDILPTQTPRRQVLEETSVSPKTSAPAVKKKSCGCCAERRARLEKKIQAARERRRQRE